MQRNPKQLFMSIKVKKKKDNNPTQIILPGSTVRVNVTFVCTRKMIAALCNQLLSQFQTYSQLLGAY